MEHYDNTVLDATVQMTESGFGAVSVLDSKGIVVGIFTDGDLRRKLKDDGKAILPKKLSEFEFNKPLTIQINDILFDAVEIIKNKSVDNLIVMDGNKAVGMLDVQDLIAKNLIG